MVVPAYIQEKLAKNSKSLRNITEEDLEMLCDLCGQHFQLFGINADDEPNEYGVQLEKLLDKLTIVEKR